MVHDKTITKRLMYKYELSQINPRDVLPPRLPLLVSSCLELATQDSARSCHFVNFEILAKDVLIFSHIYIQLIYCDLLPALLQLRPKALYKCDYYYYYLLIYLFIHLFLGPPKEEEEEEEMVQDRHVTRCYYRPLAGSVMWPIRSCYLRSPWMTLEVFGCYKTYRWNSWSICATFGTVSTAATRRPVPWRQLRFFLAHA